MPLPAMSLDGHKKFEKLMKKLPDEVQKDVVNVGLDKLSAGMVKTAKRLVPKRTGGLAKSIMRSRAPDEVKIGTGKGGKHWHLVEFGTAPHGNHPGTAPQPFFGPAFRFWQKRGERLIMAIVKQRIRRTR